MAALLGGAMFAAPCLLLSSAPIPPHHLAEITGAVRPKPVAYSDNELALASQLAGDDPPPTTVPEHQSTSTVTVSPGMTLRAVAKELDALPGHEGTSFAQVAASGVVHSFYAPVGSNDLEGVLGIGTYTIVPGESDATILNDMVLRFDDEAQKAGLTFTTAAARGYSVYQIVTVASIVQQEGYIAKNMPDVARVIYNRLTIGKPLQMNSTILYPLGVDGGAFTAKDLQLESPYNTYLNLGLPPTPICGPSLTALRAAMNPPAGNWLYFNVISSNGTEAFSAAFSAQLANENLARSLGLG